jgi:hypothetical protein
MLAFRGAHVGAGAEHFEHSLRRRNQLRHRLAQRRLAVRQCRTDRRFVVGGCAVT